MKSNFQILSIKILLIVVMVVGTGCGLTTLQEKYAAQSTAAAQPTQVPTLLSEVQNPPTQEVEMVAPPAEVATATVVVIASRDMLVPEAGAGQKAVTHDQVTENYASQKRAYSGDAWKEGVLERPFTQDMTYLPYMDIGMTVQQRDAMWVYVSIHLVAGPAAAQDNPLAYGIELDTDKDDEGDYFIWVTKPEGTDWSTKGVQVLKDESKSFSGETFGKVLASDGEGEEPDLAWARISLEDSKYVDIAFKASLIGGEKGEFIWQPWVSGLALTNAQYDPNTHFSLDVAGSPLKDNPNYPLKAVYALDNTCRRASGFVPTGLEQGLCRIVEPPKEDTAPDKPGEPPPTFSFGIMEPMWPEGPD